MCHDREHGNLPTFWRGCGCGTGSRRRRSLRLFLTGIFLAAVLGGDGLKANVTEGADEPPSSTSATPSPTDDPTAAAEQDSGTPAGDDEVARVEEHLDREMEALFAGCVCERCLGLGLLFGGGGGSLKETFIGEWSVRPDTLNLSPLAQKLSEKPASDLPDDSDIPGVDL